MPFWREIQRVKWAKMMNSSHSSHLEEPERYFEIVEGFLSDGRGSLDAPDEEVRNEKTWINLLGSVKCECGILSCIKMVSFAPALSLHPLPFAHYH